MRTLQSSLSASRRAGNAWKKFARQTALLAVVASLGSFSAQATSWYVDNAVSGGSNNGSSWANAWKSMASIGWGSVRAGDTVYISGGASSQIYYETLTIGASGTSSSPITISVGHDAGHTGQVIIDGQSSNGNGINLASYVTISGDNGNGSTNLVIRNFIDSANDWNGIGIYGDGFTGVVIKNVEIYAVNNGVTDIYPDLTQIYNCYLHNIEGDHGICLNASGTGSGQSGYDRDVVHNCTIQVNSAMNGQNGPGPDGIQGQCGVTVYSNNIVSGLGTVYGGQHQDGCQVLGEYWKIYDNTFTDLENSCAEVSQYSPNTGHFYFYNNVCRIATAAVNGYQRGIEWDCSWNSSGGYNPLSSITDVHIINNIFVDIYGYYATGYIWDGYNPTVSNFEIKNNIYYNSGSSYQPGTPIWMDPSTGYSQSDVSIDNNIVYAGPSGSSSIIVDGSTYTQAHPITGQPSFVSYSPRSPNNDFHLSATDTVAKDRGLSFPNYFTTDKEGISRPQGAAWDLGPYEYHTLGTNPVISVTPSSLNFGSLAPGMTNSLSITVQNIGVGTLTGNASVAAPFSIVSGGSYSLGAGQSQSVVVLYSPTVVATNNQTMTFTGGGGTTATVTGAAVAPLSGLTFAAGAGTITAPFVLTSGYISQPALTGVPDGGKATYNFVISSAGTYVVQMLVNAPTDSENSLYVNIDSMPTDPYMIWQMPITTNFQNSVVSWQGNGTYNSPQFVPQVFNLSAGTHQLVIVGREMGTEIQTISILSYSTNSVNTNPAIAVTPPSQNFGTVVAGTSVTNSFTVQNTGGGTLTGSASVGSPYSILSGGTYSLGAGQSQTVTVQYSPTVAGTNNQTVTFNGAGGATVSVTGSATAVMSGLVFAAGSGTITVPFVLANGSISQPAQTGVTNGGTATYTFVVTNAGSYVIQALVNAPNDSENSLYVNIDGQPADPYMVWQIPVTTGFQNLVVSWQGNGTYNSPQFIPQIFNLTAGTHQLIIVGREMNTQLQQVSILKIPSPPTGVHIISGS